MQAEAYEDYARSNKHKIHIGHVFTKPVQIKGTIAFFFTFITIYLSVNTTNI